MTALEPDGPQGSPVSIEPEDERLPVLKIVAVAVVSCVVFALGIIWALQIMRGVEHDNEREFGARAKPTAIGQKEIGMVDHTIFERERRARELLSEQTKRLDKPDWISRKDGIVRVPIRDAMKAIVEGKRAAPIAPQPSLLPQPIPGVNVPAPAQPGMPLGATGGAGAGNPSPPTTP